MITSVISLIAVLLTINTEDECFLDKIPAILAQHQLPAGYPLIIRIEDEGSLGILYVTRGDNVDVYNYVRYDTLGNLVLDLRNFATSPFIVPGSIEDFELAIPCADYIVDTNGNLWLFYTVGTKPFGKSVCWMEVDKSGAVIDKVESSFYAYNTILAAPSIKNKFQLYLPCLGMWTPEYYYYNPSLKNSVKTKSHPYFEVLNLIDLGNDKLLVTSVHRPTWLKYLVINEIGRVEKNETVMLDSCAFFKIENHGMASSTNAFHQDDSIFIGISVWAPWKKSNAFYFLRFNSKGKLLKPKTGMRKGKILSIDVMPKNVKPMISSAIDQSFVYYGCDCEGNLYLHLWSMKKNNLLKRKLK